MDDAHIRLVRTTFFDACAPGPLGDRFAQRFYERLFERSPDVRDMFPADLAGQQRKLVDELAMIVGSLDDHR